MARASWLARASDPETALTLAAAALAILATLFGGASRENAIRLGVVELSSIPLLLLALRRLAAERAWGRYTGPLILLGAIYAVVLIQLVPLPPALWTKLPGHAAQARALQLAGLPLSWRPISLSPQDGAASALALLPPTAMFLATLSLDSSALRLLIRIWLALAVAGLMLGAFQLLAPDARSWAYPYKVTHYDFVVGFFANRNHEASYLVALLPLAGALGAARSRSGRPDLMHLSAILFVILACIGLAAARSRMGLVLTPPALVAAGMIAWLSSAGRGQSRLRSVVAVSALVIATVCIVGAMALGPILDRFAPGLDNEVRLQAWPYVEKAADGYLPLGSGIGSFDMVFRAVEPLALVAPEYFNHAHNEYLEVWLETGWLGIATLIAFVFWFAPIAVRAWLRAGPERDLARAASVVILLLMAHSFVDYPLRTTTMSVLFAYACALVARFDAAQPRQRGAKSRRTASNVPPEQVDRRSTRDLDAASPSTKHR